MNNIEEKIKQFIVKYGEKIDKEDMPSVILQWRKSSNSCKSDQAILINAIDGQTEPLQHPIIYRSANSKIIYPYIKYDEELDVMALTIATIDSSRTKPLEREWKPIDCIYYIVNHQKILYNSLGVEAETLMVANTRYTWHVKSSEYLKRVVKYSWYISGDEVIKFLGSTFNISGFTMVPTRAHHLAQWFNRKDRSAKNNIDLISAPLPDLEIKDEWVALRRKYNMVWGDFRQPLPVRFSTVNGYDVIRIYNDEKKEFIRIFIQRTKTVIFIKNRDVWEKGITTYRNVMIFKYYFVPIPNEIKNLQYIKYTANIFLTTELLTYDVNDTETLDTTLDLNKILLLTKYPIIEKLCKAFNNKTHIVADFLSYIQESGPHVALEKLFGKINTKKEGLCRQLGINKYQFDSILDTNIKDCIIGAIKRELDADDISFLDNNTYEAFVKYEHWEKEHWFSIRGEKVTSFDVCNIRALEQKYTLCKRLYKIWHDSQNGTVDTIYQIFFDTLTICCQILRRNFQVPHINWMELKTSRDFVTIHDNITNYYNRLYYMSKNEYYEKLNKRYSSTLQANKNKYEFEDSNYLIKYPENPVEELEKEGVSLSHCVGGYTDRHMTGATTILFLREKNSPDAPFLTIEVKDDEVKQIHGRYNAWMGSCQQYLKAIPFAMKWLHKTNIHCQEEILTNCSTGYAKSSKYIDLPTVDFDISDVIIRSKNKTKI